MSSGEALANTLMSPTPPLSQCWPHSCKHYFSKLVIYFPADSAPHMQRASTLNLGRGEGDLWPPQDDRHLFIPHRYLCACVFGCVKRMFDALTPCVMCSAAAVRCARQRGAAGGRSGSRAGARERTKSVPHSARPLPAQCPPSARHSARHSARLFFPTYSRIPQIKKAFTRLRRFFFYREISKCS